MTGSEQARTLHAARPGEQVRLAAIDVPAEHRLRLAELGVRAGGWVRVLGRTVGGGRVIGIGADRLALDRRIAQQIVLASGR